MACTDRACRASAHLQRAASATGRLRVELTPERRPAQDCKGLDRFWN